MGLDRLLIDRVLADRYRVVSLLGHGGMGLVFRGEDLMLGRKVALKVMQLESESDAGIFGARFRREAQVAARLQHPNIITVFDFGVDAGLDLPFLVMELLLGQDLHAVIAEMGKQSAGVVRRILSQAAEGLGAGHAEGVVHRDIKPSNLFLVGSPSSPSCRVVLLDFGIARIASGLATETRLTRMGHVPHSPAFAAPEQVAGSSAITPAADVFSLAATGWQMLVGGDRASREGDARAELLAPGAFGGAETALRQLLARSLDPDPLRRPQNGQAFAAELERLEELEQHAAAPTTEFTPRPQSAIWHTAPPAEREPAKGRVPRLPDGHAFATEQERLKEPEQHAAASTPGFSRRPPSSTRRGPQPAETQRPALRRIPRVLAAVPIVLVLVTATLAAWARRDSQEPAPTEVLQPIAPPADWNAASDLVSPEDEAAATQSAADSTPVRQGERPVMVRVDTVIIPAPVPTSSAERSRPEPARDPQPRPGPTPPPQPEAQPEQVIQSEPRREPDSAPAPAPRAEVIRSRTAPDNGAVAEEAPRTAEGRWRGRYRCAQGQTGMTLVLQELPDGSVRGTISFYPIAENPNVPSGRFSVSGARDGNMLMIEPDSWINQPPRYTMVAMEGTIRSGGNVYSGNMLDPGCGTFRLERQGSSGRN